jgi:hypothetical protein
VTNPKVRYTEINILKDYDDLPPSADRRFLAKLNLRKIKHDIGDDEGLREEERTFNGDRPDFAVLPPSRKRGTP